MKQATLAKWLKLIIIGVGICGLIVFAVVVPMLAKTMIDSYPEFSNYRWPWMILIWIMAVPCYMVLILAWKIVTNIGLDRSFSVENAKLFKWIAVLAIIDSVILFVGNLIFLFLNMTQPSIVLISFIVEFFGIAISVVAAALSHLVNKAADLQDQSNLTI